MSADPRRDALAEALAGQGVEVAYLHPIAPPFIVFVGAAGRDALRVPVILRAARLALGTDDVRITFLPASASLPPDLIRILSERS
ncbi:hypothetical protein GCM10022286_00390 [Gryllotalpicola daejeonensis]|uniref:Uncharacterized protein n=1 Tax=Gryllotalpicola daejeonensis TaxID=993087 RepID=A0ABP7ZGB5_9MICO